MNVVIRTDSSIQIGTGHVMRCLTLACELRLRGAEIKFICRKHNGNLGDLIKLSGFQLQFLPASIEKSAVFENDFSKVAWSGITWKQDAIETIAAIDSQLIDYIIVDHYAIDYRWHKKLRPFTNKIMAIDDIANRMHDCDILLDQNLYQDNEARYERLITTANCERLLGPKFALLRPEFSKIRRKLKIRDGTIKRIFIFFGGSDYTNETCKALEAIKILSRPDIFVDVVLGKANPHMHKVRALCSTLPNVKINLQVNNIEELMASADLSIGAGGSTTWERFCLGLPSMVIVVADNQKDSAENLSKNNLVYYIGKSEEVTTKTIFEAIIKIIGSPDKNKLISKKCSDLVDGGGVKRVSNKLLTV